MTRPDLADSPDGVSATTTDAPALGITPAPRHGTAIGWTHWPGTRGETLVDVTGCDPASAGCGFPLGPGHCYSAVQSSSHGPRGLAKHPKYAGVAVDGQFTGLVRIHPDLLEEPLHHRMRRTYFHNSMSDTLHPKVPDWFIAWHLAVAAYTSRHNYLELSKRHARLAALLRSTQFRGQVEDRYHGRFGPDAPPIVWPLANVAFGVSVENQEAAEVRMPKLVEAAEYAACVFVSCEPLLGEVDLTPWMGQIEPGKLWVIGGGQSGKDYQLVNLDHLRRLRDDCAAHGAPYYLKQIGGARPTSGGRTLDGREHNEFPAMAYRAVAS